MKPRSRRRAHPVSAHVLYLEVAPEVAAPTLLWVPGATPSLRVVQATPRLLRFAGDPMHVPRPACEYIGEDEAAADSDDEGGEEDRGGGRRRRRRRRKRRRRKRRSREKRATTTMRAPPCATSFFNTWHELRGEACVRCRARGRRVGHLRRAPTSCACVASRSLRRARLGGSAPRRRRHPCAAAGRWAGRTACAAARFRVDAVGAARGVARGAHRCERRRPRELPDVLMS